MILTRRSNLLSTLLTCYGRVRRLLKRALRRMSSSCLHQRLIWLLEVDPSTTTGAADASRLQRELREVASGTKWEMRRAAKCEEATCRPPARRLPSNSDTAPPRGFAPRRRSSDFYIHTWRRSELAGCSNSRRSC